jgi:hypothetical protein
MQKSSTGCKLLLITPAIYILLQVALALHHHHFESYHDDKDSLHSFPKTSINDHAKQDKLIYLVPASLLSLVTWIWIRSPEPRKAAITVLISDPPQSRAPPALLYC